VTSTIEQVAHLAARVCSDLDGTPLADSAHDIRHRIEEPLRVAIAGRVKAGKSTLLNALIGDRLAPTDAGECTKVVTWYRNGLTYRVLLHDVDGRIEPARFSRTDDQLDITVGPDPSARLRRITVEWPAQSLEKMTLIDLPGVGSINDHISARSEQFLQTSERPSEADAVLYLMRHLHDSDMSFLESFHDLDRSRPGVLNAIGVLSRADEIGVGLRSSMNTARRIADRYTQDSRLRPLCQTVVPLAGLLGETAVTLRQHEFAALRELARGDITPSLLSVDRFVAAADEGGPSREVRQRLLERFGVFGLRTSCEYIRTGLTPTSPALANNLVQLSGLGELRALLSTQFGGRHDVLRSWSALVALRHLADNAEGLDPELVKEIERITASTHAFSELRLLNLLRAGGGDLTPSESKQAERLLGASGAAAHDRLAAPADTPLDQLAQIAIEHRRAWNELAEHPARSLETRSAARVLTHSCEAIAAASIHA